MDAYTVDPMLLHLLARLSSTVSSCSDFNDTLRKVCALSREALRAKVSVIVLLNDDGVSRVSSQDGQETQTSRTWWFNEGTANEIDEALFRRGEFVEKYGLKSDGQGVTSAAVAQREDFNSMIAAPIKREGELSGYVVIFAETNKPFSGADKDLLNIFADHVGLALRSELHRNIESSFLVLNDISLGLPSSSASRFLKTVADRVCDLLHVQTCVVWEYDEAKRHLRVAACTGNVDPDYKSMTLSDDDPQVHHKFLGGTVVYIADVTTDSAEYSGKHYAKKHGWVSLLTVPLFVEGRLAGLLDVYTNRLRTFQEWEKRAFHVFANEAALALHHVQWRVQELDSMLSEIGGAPNKGVLFESTLRNALRLVDAERGWLGILNVQTGCIDIVAKEGDLPGEPSFSIGTGIAGRALADEAALRIDDVTKDPNYIACWTETRSQLAIPLVIDKAEVRKGRQITFGSRRIGVLNLESSTLGAFFHLDETRLKTLARAAASAFDRLDIDLKLRKLSQIETEMLQRGMNFQQTVDRILRAINDTLGFSFVNISLIDADAGRIRTEYVVGLSPDKAARFKKLADHSLNAEPLDIQAEVARSREIEVPDSTDTRFDQSIFQEFAHNELVRVYIPMISPSGTRAVGTVEAGYPAKFQPYIYERDVRVLNDFVLFVTEALEQRREQVLETIMHEFRAPAAAIRSNVSFVSRHLAKLTPQHLQRKLDDLALDSELMLLQISKVEQFLGGVSVDSVAQRTVVYRDIIIKTVNQLKPEIQGAGFDIFKVHYDVSDTGRMVLFVDPIKLNQVVFNLLINAIKYAERDRKQFAIRIEMAETAEMFVVKFRDWGIGVRKEHRDRLFEQGFRAPEARASFVTGSGFGLWIAKNIMKDLGGDLLLTNTQKPTEFSVFLPKSLKEAAT